MNCKPQRTVRRFEPIDESVWCDIHGCVHDKTHDPYDCGTTPDEAECGPSDWRKLWAGAYAKQNTPVDQREASGSSGGSQQQERKQ